MKKLPLDLFYDYPSDMKRYLRYNGYHFTKKAYEYAVSLMKKKDSVGRTVAMKPYTKEEVDNFLNRNNIVLDNAILYDYVFVYTMAQADYYGSSITDEQHLAKFVKDYVDDVDAPCDVTFRRWLATMLGAGEFIDWIEIV